MSTPVAVVMGSQSDWETMKEACDALTQFGVGWKAEVVSAHRTPQRMYDFAKTAHDNGYKVIIAGAGGAAHLPGMTHDPRSLVRRTRQPASVSRPVSSPIQTSVVYASRDADELDAQYEGREQGFTYSREGHPNAAIVGAKIDWLEGVAPEWGKGVVTGSGMGAVSAVMLALLKAGDHVVAGNQLYGRSLRLLTQDMPRLGIEATLADPTDAAAFEAAIRPETRMILVEVVSNPTLRVADMKAIAEIAKRRGVIFAVDNTFTTPRAWRPFEHGANVVIHSITKLLAGHSDAMLGYAVANDPAMNKAIYDTAVTWGFAPSPFDCWLAERGLATFDLRYDRAEANAAKLAEAAGAATQRRCRPRPSYAQQRRSPAPPVAARELGR